MAGHLSLDAYLRRVRRRRYGAVALLAWDKLNRANGPLGTSDSGHAWAQHGAVGDITISGNKAVLSTATDAAGRIALYDAGAADVSHSAIVNIGNGRACVVARATDNANAFFTDSQGGPDQIWIKRIQAGTVTTILTAGRTLVAGDRLGIRCKGSTLELLHNGVSVGSVTDTFNQTATKHGIGSYTTLTGGEWDDVETAAA